MKLLKTLIIFFICLFSINFIKAETITIYYHRFEKDYDKWNLWIWKKGGQGKSYKIAGKNDYGVYFKINLGKLNNPEEIGFIVRKGNWEGKDIDADRNIKPGNNKKFFLIQGDKKIYTSQPSLLAKIIGAYVDSKKKITVYLSKKINSKKLNKNTVVLLDNKLNKVPVEKIFSGYIIKPVNTFEIILPKKHKLKVSKNLSKYKLQITGFKPKKLTMRKILSDNFFYSDKQLGYIYKPKATIFRVFSPTAAKVTLQIYNSITSSTPKVYNLKKGKKGLWSKKIKKNLLDKYYTYKVYGDENFTPEKEIIDIYSKCNTGKHNKGLIINDNTFIEDSPKFNIEDSIIYELNIRDFTIDTDSHVKNRGKYLGMTETGTKYKNFKTGIDHLVDLGVNVVQIMPVQDFDNDEEDFNTYNWGYMPCSFNSPDAWFAGKITDDSRVKEFKKTVDALHKKGIKVVMDVVYNHTSPNASFQKIVPGYYFRTKPDGTFWNGSGCGNEFQTEYPMAKKYIIDSLKYWVKEYKIDGFRFDLMGLIDIDTMKIITKELKKINKDILIYGEPWSAGETPTKQTIKGTQKGKGFFVFNDHYRDAIKGSVFSLDMGYVQGKISSTLIKKIKSGLSGSINDFTKDPLESINYAACHDNHTLWDRINLSLAKNNDKVVDNIKLKKRMQKLSGGLVLLAQGIPFIHSGQEMCRTKKGDENSYNKDDSINKIYWQWKKKYNDVFLYYKGLIALRKAHKSFKLKTKKEVEKSIKFTDAPYGCIAYQITNKKDQWKNIIVLINPHRANKTFTLPDGLWNLVADEKTAGNKIIKSHIKNKINIEPVSLAVLYK